MNFQIHHCKKLRRIPLFLPRGQGKIEDLRKIGSSCVWSMVWLMIVHGAIYGGL